MTNIFSGGGGGDGTNCGGGDNDNTDKDNGGGFHCLAFLSSSKFLFFQMIQRISQCVIVVHCIIVKKWFLL